MDANIYSDRIQAAPETRGVTAAWLAKEAGTVTSNISRYTTGGSYPRSLKIIVKMAKALRVSTDYLLGVTDIMDPVARDAGLVGKFDDKYSYLYEDEGFLTCVEICNALSDEDRKCMAGIVKEYGMNRNVLNPEGKAVTVEKDGEDR